MRQPLESAYLILDIVVMLYVIYKEDKIGSMVEFEV